MKIFNSLRLLERDIYTLYQKNQYNEAYHLVIEYIKPKFDKNIYLNTKEFSLFTLLMRLYPLVNDNLEDLKPILNFGINSGIKLTHKHINEFLNIIFYQKTNNIKFILKQINNYNIELNIKNYKFIAEYFIWKKNKKEFQYWFHKFLVSELNYCFDNKINDITIDINYFRYLSYISNNKYQFLEYDTYNNEKLITDEYNISKIKFTKSEQVNLLNSLKNKILENTKYDRKILKKEIDKFRQFLQDIKHKDIKYVIDGANIASLNNEYFSYTILLNFMKKLKDQNINFLLIMHKRHFKQLKNYSDYFTSVNHYKSMYYIDDDLFTLYSGIYLNTTIISNDNYKEYINLFKNNFKHKKWKIKYWFAKFLVKYDLRMNNVHLKNNQIKLPIIKEVHHIQKDNLKIIDYYICNFGKWYKFHFSSKLNE
jgi:hypothetical protein